MLAADDVMQRWRHIACDSRFRKIITPKTTSSQVIFSCIPPANIWNGWACFFCALIALVGLTALINDLASIFGCLINLKVFCCCCWLLGWKVTSNLHNTLRPSSRHCLFGRFTLGFIFRLFFVIVLSGKAAEKNGWERLCVCFSCSAELSFFAVQSSANDANWCRATGFC